MKRDEARAWRIAREQMWLITLDQLRECGFTIAAVKHRLATGRLWRVFAGVYAVGRPEVGRERLALAAVLSCGAGAGQSLMWAAWHLGIWEAAPPLLPQVTVPSDSGRVGRAGIEVHRSASLMPGDVIRHNGIPTTTVFRTLTDNAAQMTEGDIRSMLRQAQRRHETTLSSVSRYLEDRSRRAAGAARLRRVLANYLPKSALTPTEREAMFFEPCDTHGIPLPEPQHPIAGLRADFAWPRFRVVTGLDDRESHEGQIQHGDDLIRDRVYRANGWHPERFTVVEAVNQPDLVANQLRPLLTR